MTALSAMQLDALCEVANIGSGNAGTALGTLLGRSVDISVPTAALLPLADAAASAGDAAALRHGIVVPIRGELDAVVLVLLSDEDARALCGVYGLDPGTPDGRSMLGEVGNILGSSYVNVLAQMMAIEADPGPPEVVEDMLGAILTTVLLSHGDVDTALIMNSSLMVEGERCSLSFMLLPDHAAVGRLLQLLGME